MARPLVSRHLGVGEVFGKQSIFCHLLSGLGEGGLSLPLESGCRVSRATIWSAAELESTSSWCTSHCVCQMIRYISIVVLLFVHVLVLFCFHMLSEFEFSCGLL